MFNLVSGRNELQRRQVSEVKKYSGKKVKYTCINVIYN